MMVREGHWQTNAAISQPSQTSVNWNGFEWMPHSYAEGRCTISVCPTAVEAACNEQYQSKTL